MPDNTRFFAAALLTVEGLNPDTSRMDPATMATLDSAYILARKVLASCPWAPRHSTGCAEYGPAACDGQRCAL